MSVWSMCVYDNYAQCLNGFKELSVWFYTRPNTGER